jgi:uncharacterized protein YdeI (BOF family)
MRHMLAILVLLLGVSWAVAQTTPSSSGGSQNGNTTTDTQGNTAGAQTSTHPQMGSGQTSTGSHVTVEGCLSGSNGQYTLTDKQGTTYQLMGDSSKLADHVGHEVKVTGSENTASASGTAGTAGGGATASGQTLEVTSVKHISKTCKNNNMNGGSMSH